jgi:hypothetical protein
LNRAVDLDVAPWTWIVAPRNWLIRPTVSIPTGPLANVRPRFI